MKGLKFSLILLLLFSPTLWGGETAPCSGSSPLKELQKQLQQEFQRNNYKKVVSLYQGFEENCPDYYRPLIMRIYYSQSLADTGDIDQATKVLEEIIAEVGSLVDPVKFYYDLGNLFFMQHRIEEAKGVYQKVLFLSSRHQEMVAKVREKVGLMKKGEARKKDLMALQLFDIESSLEAGEIPEGVQSFLRKVQEENPSTPNGEKAKNLLSRVMELRSDKAKSYLDEARRLFDEEKKYSEVRTLLNQLRSEYADVCETKSIEALEKAVDLREGKK